MNQTRATALQLNKNGGVYHRGKAYTDDKKLQVALHYIELLEEEGEVSSRRLAAVAKVGKNFANKIIQEVTSGVVVLGFMRPPKNIPRGHGSKTLTPEDEHLLLMVCHDNPKALLCMHQGAIFHHHGTLVSKSTISRWMATRFPHKMTFRKANKVPVDKFSPLNAIGIHECNLTISLFLGNPHKIKFGDEKPLKGADLFNRKARKDPFTGVVPVTVVDSDFGNRCNIIGFCGIDMRCPAMDFCIVGEDQTTAAATFMAAIESSVAKGFLSRGDILVLDNAAIHCYRESEGLAAYLWAHGILLLPLPTRVPELNPIELIWNTLVQRLRALAMSAGGGRHAVVEFTAQILSAITHHEVAKYYAHCGYMAKEQ